MNFITFLFILLLCVICITASSNTDTNLSTDKVRQQYACVQTITFDNTTQVDNQSSTSSFSCRAIDLSRSYSINSFICTDSADCSYHGQCNRDHTTCVCDGG